MNSIRCDKHQLPMGTSYCNLCEVEREREKVESLEEGIRISAGLKCPNCDDVGFIPVQVSEDHFEQEQCEFCYTIPDSVFNRGKT